MKTNVLISKTYSLLGMWTASCLPLSTRPSPSKEGGRSTACSGLQDRPLIKHLDGLLLDPTANM
ncbi:hypothetical protein SK128_006871, partial [Halocaridina rubra]